MATFCNAFANDLPIQVNDPSVELELLYIDDLVDEMIAGLQGKEHHCEVNGRIQIASKASIGDTTSRCLCFLLPNYLDYSIFLFIFETKSRGYSHSKKQKNANYFAFSSFNRIFDLKMRSKIGGISEKFKYKFGFSLDFHYLCPRLLLILMHWRSIVDGMEGPEIWSGW